MIVTYTFTQALDEDHDETYEYEYRVPLQTLYELADEYHDGDEPSDEYNEFIENGGTNLEYYEDDSGFYEFVHDSVEDDARKAFEDDNDFWDGVREAEEYRKDPYAYYGVSRWDFV